MEKRHSLCCYMFGKIHKELLDVFSFSEGGLDLFEDRVALEKVPYGEKS